MEKVETIIDSKDNIINLYVDEKIYNITVIKKALFNFIDDGYFKLQYSKENEINVQIYLKSNIENTDIFIKQIYNELLNESLRFDIMNQTKNIRELMLGRALYSTCIDTDESSEYEENSDDNNEYKIDNIAVNWFDKNGDNKC